MIYEHFIIISLKKLSSLVSFKLDNLKKSELSFDNSNIIMNLGKDVDISFLDDELMLIKSNDTEVRIDIDIASIEKSIKKYKSENNVSTK